jgi:hypothetical protein
VLREVQIQGEGSVFFGVKKMLNPSFWHIWGTKIVKNWLKMRKLWPLKEGGVKNSKQQTTTNSWTPKNFRLCCFVVIIVQRLFVELKVALVKHFKSFKMKRIWESYELWKEGSKYKEKKTCFISMKVFSSTFIGFFSFLIPK